MPGNLYTYDPAGPAWNPGTKAGCDPRVLGIPVIDSWRPGTEMSVRDLLEGPDGVIYGCIFFWETAYAEECRQKGDGSSSTTPRSPGIPAPAFPATPATWTGHRGRDAVNSCAWAMTNGSSADLTRTLPRRVSAPRRAGEGSSAWTRDGMGHHADLQDLGKADPDIDEAWGSVAHPEAGQDVIYMCTATGRVSFRTTLTGRPSRPAAPGSKVSFSDLIVGPEERSTWAPIPLPLAVYDPSHPETGMRTRVPSSRTIGKLSAWCPARTGWSTWAPTGTAGEKWFDGSSWPPIRPRYPGEPRPAGRGLPLGESPLRLYTGVGYRRLRRRAQQRLLPLLEVPPARRHGLPRPTPSTRRRPCWATDHPAQHRQRQPAGLSRRGGRGGDVYAGTHVDWPNEPEISTVTGGYFSATTRRPGAGGPDRPRPAASVRIRAHQPGGRGGRRRSCSHPPPRPIWSGMPFYGDTSTWAAPAGSRPSPRWSGGDGACTGAPIPASDSSTTTWTAGYGRPGHAGVLAQRGDRARPGAGRAVYGRVGVGCLFGV